MAFELNRRTPTRTMAGTAAGAAIDEGLRQYMLRIYNYMASALALTGVVAWVTANTPALFNAIFGTPLMWVSRKVTYALTISPRWRSGMPHTATSSTAG